MTLFKAIRVLPCLIRTSYNSSAVRANQKRTYADEKVKQDMAFTFASPAGAYYDKADVRQIDVPSFSGNFGILPNHVPLLAVLQPGVLTVTEKDGNQNQFFVSSGSVCINDDSSVQILCEEACKVSDLDANAIRDGLSKAQQEMTSASGEKEKAEARIAVECYEALQKAV